MATDKQKIGAFGERIVTKQCSCPKCKQGNTLKKLPPNFKCADIVCDFCGYLAQVKATSVTNIEVIPKKITAAAWGPQKERMDAGIYFPLYLVLKNKKTKQFSIYYLAADLQEPEMFLPRKRLSKNAKRAGWQGFTYDLTKVPTGAIVRLR